MIDNPEPVDWQDLQNSVANILTDVGFQVEIAKTVKTPRGSVEIDVWAEDNSGTEKITYLIECKNWNKTIPQSVIHSLTTVAQEAGANVAYLISKKGTQSGANKYTENTNIKAMSYLEFQSQYMDSWWSSFAQRAIASCADRLIQYTEPINGFRQRRIKFFSQEEIAKYNLLSEKYYPVAYFFCTLESAPSFSEFRNKIEVITQGKLIISSEYYRGSLVEIRDYLDGITKEFDLLFKEKLFA